MKVLGIIPARRGSRGVPGKNVRRLGGKAVIEYTIADALAAERIDRAAVTSDDPEVEEICKKYEEIIFVKRPGDLAGDAVRIDEVMRHCCRELAGRFNYQPDIVALLYANVPVRAAGIIDKAIEHLIASGADSVQTLAPVGKFHPYWLYRMEEDKISKYEDKPIYRRQDLPPLFAIDSAVGVVKYEVLMKSQGDPDPHAFWGEDRRGIAQQAHETVDIDIFRDLLVAEAALKE